MGFTISGSFQRASNMLLMKNIDEKLKTAEYKSLTMFNPSQNASEVVEFLGTFAGMSEWKDVRKVRNLSKNKFTIENKQYEDTLGFKKKDWNNLPAMIKAQIPGLAEAVVDHPTNLIFALMVANATCFDGQPMFDTSHPFMLEDAESTYSNLHTGTGSTVAQVQADFDAAMVLLQGYKKRNGEPIYADYGIPTIYHGPSLNKTMREAFKSTVIGTNTNTLYEGAITKSTGYLSGNDWYLCLLNKEQKPFIFQEREKVKGEWDFTQQFSTGSIHFGLDGQYAVAPGHPQLAIKVNN